MKTKPCGNEACPKLVTRSQGHMGYDAETYYCSKLCYKAGRSGKPQRHPVNRHYKRKTAARK